MVNIRIRRHHLLQKNSLLLDRLQLRTGPERSRDSERPFVHGGHKFRVDLGHQHKSTDQKEHGNKHHQDLFVQQTRQHLLITAVETAQYLIDKKFFLFPRSKLVKKQGNDRHGNDKRGQHGHDDRHAKLGKQLSRQSVHRAERQINDHRCDRGCDDRSRHVTGSFQRCLLIFSRLVFQTEAALQHHDRTVNHHTDRNDKCPHRHHVKRKSKHVHADHGRKKRDRHRTAHDQARAQIPEKQEQYRHGKHDAQYQCAGHRGKG